VKYGIPIKHVLLDNGVLGKISKEQRAAGYDVWMTSLRNPDFGDFAESCGALGICVDTAAELPDALARAFAHDGPVCVHIHADPELV
jgi:thiamine pyrophosphate-dependent acetolactate synthase large subunit-like protein